MSQNTLPATTPAIKPADTSGYADSRSAGVAVGAAAESVGSAVDNNVEPARDDLSGVLLPDDLKDAWYEDLEVAVVSPVYAMSDREAIIGSRALDNAQAFIRYMEQSLTFATAASVTARCDKYAMYGETLKGLDFPVLLPHSNPSVDAKVDDYVSRANDCYKEIRRMKRTISQMEGFKERYVKYVAGDRQAFQRPLSTQSRLSPNTSRERPVRVSRMRSLFSGRAVDVHSPVSDEDPENRTFREGTPDVNSGVSCGKCASSRSGAYSPHTEKDCTYWLSPRS